MKAIICEKYGKPSVFQMTEMETPIPDKNQLLIQIQATAVNIADIRMREAKPFAIRFFLGFFRPKFPVLGGVFSGKIIQIGSQVSKFKVGDEVFGSTALNYGFGSYATHKILPENGILAKKPQNVSHLEAASIPFGALTAFSFLSKVNVSCNQNVCVIGASGSVGTAFLQLLKIKNAKITAVCGSSKKEKIQEIGPNRFLTYQEFDQLNTKFDLVIDCSNVISVSKIKKILSENGKAILVAADLKKSIFASFYNSKSKNQFIFGLAKESKEALESIAIVVENMQYKPIVDRIFPLEQMELAHIYAEKREKFGNIAIDVNE